MRATPISVWAQELSQSEITQAVEQDVTLVHSNPLMIEIVASYSIAIQTLIKNHNQENRLQLAFDNVKEYAKSKEVQEWLQKAVELAGNMEGTGKTFFPLEFYNPQPQMGFVKHGIVLAFYCLLKIKEIKIEEAFDFAMEQTAMLAGDTDTNCAIVGGLIGAYTGVENIDKEKLKKVLESDHKQGGQKVRP